MNISIKNIGSDRFNDQIGSNAIQIKIGDQIIDTPMIAAHQSELKRAQKSSISLNTNLVQYIYKVRKKELIDNSQIKNKITKDIKTIIDKNPKCIVDVFFQYGKNYFPLQVERKNILQIQNDAGCPFISDYESNPNQSVSEFKEQLQQTLQKYPDKIICPTLDLVMDSSEKFSQKIDLLLECGIRRFNVIYRNMTDHQDNWITLSEKIYGKDIWCNLVGVSSQYPTNKHTTIKYSYIAQAFLYGVHTASLQYPNFSQDLKESIKKKKRSGEYTFNSISGCFNITTTMTQDQARANSINAIIEYLQKIRTLIISQKYYSDFVVTNPRLLHLLPKSDG